MVDVLARMSHLTVSKVAAGAGSSMAITSNGHLFYWGKLPNAPRGEATMWVFEFCAFFFFFSVRFGGSVRFGFHLFDFLRIPMVRFLLFVGTYFAGRSRVLCVAGGSNREPNHADAVV